MVLFTLPFMCFHIDKMARGARRSIVYVWRRLFTLLVQEPELVVRICMSFLFASPEHLGLDPKVKRIVTNKTTLDSANKTKKVDCYVYNVGGRFFRSLEVLSEIKSLRISGRTTRVLKVKEVKPNSIEPVDGAKAMVLKDVWTDAKSPTESDIKREILEDIKKLPRDRKAYVTQDTDSTIIKSLLEDALNAPQNFFLTDCCSETGIQSKERARDAKLADSLLVVPAALSRATSHSIDPSRNSEQSEPMAPPTPKFPKRAFAPRRQYRVVFEEVCQALHELGSWKETTMAITGALHGRCGRCKVCISADRSRLVSHVSCWMGPS